MKNPISLTGITLLLAVSSLSAATHYVSLESTNPTPPYATWATAARNIQQAVDAAATSDEVVVTNGVYSTGNRTIDGLETNRVAVDKPVTVRSVNGPEATIIDGLGAMRCVYLTNNAALVGFTVTNGSTFTRPTRTGWVCGYGAGVYCEPTNAFLTNCVIVGNTEGAYWSTSTGVGVYQGTLYDCRLSGNRASAIEGGAAGAGAYGSTLYNCTLTDNEASGWGSGAGGGAYGSVLYNCTLSGNSASEGGGACSSTLYNCTLTGNSVTFGHGMGGGACSSTLYNCTLTGNSAYYDGGGAFGSTLNNCIVYFNTNGDHSGSTMNYCCTTPMPTNALGNITNAPLFVDYGNGNLCLQTDSPCINAGNNDYVTTSMDLDGNPRISGGVVDIGAYEFVFTPSMAVGQLMLWVNDSGLGTKNKQPLLATLSAALASFDRGNFISGANQLAAFQNKVRAQVARIDAELANELIATAQRIIQDVTGRGL
jgi:hypothetical protein